MALLAAYSPVDGERFPGTSPLGVTLTNAVTKYASTGNSTYSYIPGRYPGSLALVGRPSIVSGAAMEARVAVPAYAGSLIVGFARRQDPVQAVVTTALQLVDTGGSAVLDLSVSAAGTVSAGSVGSGSFTSAAGVAPRGVWHYFEVKVNPRNSGGYIEVRVNGVVLHTFTGDTYSPTGTVHPVAFADFTISRPSSPSTPETHSVAVGDIYIADTSGAVNNDFLGEITLARLVPSGPGGKSDLVGSDGNSVDNWALVANPAPDGSQYVESDVIGAEDRYAFSNVPAGSGPVAAVIPRFVGGSVEPGFVGLAMVAQTAEGRYVSPGLSLPTTLGPLSFLPVDEKPGGGAWTHAAVNDLEVGVQVVSI